MNLPQAALFIFCALLVHTIGAEPANPQLKPIRQIEISATFKDFPKTFALDKKMAGKLPPGVLAILHVTTKAGNHAVIETIREVRFAVSEKEFETVNAGVTLEVTPTVKDGQVVISGRCLVVQHLQPEGEQPLHATTFARHETYFTGTVPKVGPFTIDVGNGDQDKAKIILSAALLSVDTATPAKLKKAKQKAL